MMLSPFIFAYALQWSAAHPAIPQVPRAVATAAESAALRYNIPTPLILAVAKTESRYDPNAVSSSGAQGVMQLMPITANRMQVHNPFSVRQSINGGAHYLHKMLVKFGGNVRLALAAYTSGPNVITHDHVPAWDTGYVQKMLHTDRLIAATL